MESASARKEQEYAHLLRAQHEKRNCPERTLREFPSFCARSTLKARPPEKNLKSIPLFCALCLESASARKEQKHVHLFARSAWKSQPSEKNLKRVLPYLRALGMESATVRKDLKRACPSFARSTWKARPPEKELKLECYLICAHSAWKAQPIEKNLKEYAHLLRAINFESATARKKT